MNSTLLRAEQHEIVHVLTVKTFVRKSQVIQFETSCISVDIWELLSHLFVH